MIPKDYNNRLWIVAFIFIFIVLNSWPYSVNTQTVS